MPGNKQNTSYKKPLIIVTALFFMWGFITAMNDILIPFLKKVFELSYFESMMVQFAFFGAYFLGSVLYFIISVSKGDPIVKIGYKNGIIAGLLLSAAGTLLFYPAAALKLYGFFLAALFVLGLGFTLLQIAANPYVAVLGPRETASSRLNLSQAFNSFGTTIAPIVGGFLVFHYFANWGQPFLNKMGEIIKTDTGAAISANGVQLPYLIFTAIFVLLALMIKFSKLPKIAAEDDTLLGAGALRYKQLVFGMIAIFMYVGAEVSIGSILINYMNEQYSMPVMEAKSFLAFYWGGAMIGRFLGAVSLGDMTDEIKKYVIMTGLSLGVFLLVYAVVWIEADFAFPLKRVLPYFAFLVLNLFAFRMGKAVPARTLLIFAIVNVFLLAIALTQGGIISMWSLLSIGLFNSIMWSNIFTLSIAGLGKHTSQGSSLLVMMILGGALVPLIQGALADKVGVHLSFIVPLFCYAYLIYYGWKGYKQGFFLRKA